MVAVLNLAPPLRPPARHPRTAGRVGGPADVRLVPAATFRRRRAVVTLLVGVLVLVAAVVAGRPGVSSPADTVGASVAGGSVVPGGSVIPAGGAVTHVVAPGDSVWSIARRRQPDGDVRPLVDRIVAANGGAVIVVGQRLVVDG